MRSGYLLCNEAMARIPKSPKSCEKCGSDQIAYVAYGLITNPGREFKKALAAGEVVRGGCMIQEGFPEWRCRNCLNTWGDAKRSFDSVVAFVRQKEDHMLRNDGRILLQLVHGDLLDQPVEVIVNAWNRNIIPWWLLLPQGVSGAIKKRGGYEPFKELGRMGAIPPGGAVVTGPGRLPFKAIIHVAGINMLWRSSEQIIRDCVVNAMNIVREKGYKSVAFPLIGAGTGGFDEGEAFQIMQDSLAACDFQGEVRIVRFKRA